MTKINDNISRLILSISKADFLFLIEEDKGNVSVLHAFGNLEIHQQDIEKLTLEVIKDHTNLTSSEIFNEFKNNYSLNDIYVSRINYLDSLYSLVVLNKNKFGNSDETLAQFELINKILVDNILSNKEIDLFTDVFENVDAVIYTINRTTKKFLFMKGSLKNLYGFIPENIITNPFLSRKIIAEENLKEFLNFNRKALNGQKSVLEYKINDKLGNIRYVRHTAIPVNLEGNKKYIIGIVIDITDEKRIQRLLESSEAKFRQLVETADDLIFSLNKNGYFQSINKSGSNALGYSSEEIINKHFLEFIDDDSKADIAVVFQDMLTNANVTTFETTFLERFGSKLVFEIQASPLYEEGKINGLIGIGRDITQRRQDELKLKELNTKLIEANRIISIERDRAKQQITVLEELNKLKNEFISNVSHELRTPLASIVGFAETIVSDAELPQETIHEFSNIILTEGKRLARLVNDILDFSKLESGTETLNRINFNLAATLKELSETFKESAESKGISLNIEIPEAQIEIFADKERIQKAFSNIISNGIKFTDKGGRVSILVQDFLKEVEVIISDTGIGIPNEKIPELFQKFSKVNRPGSQIPGAGFGLVTVKQIIDLHKGLIQVKSEINKGTSFIVRLPKKN
ncbi:MAG: PAS domain-containing sensor histidine kinase [Melioribacteraceae bacterium]|nr:PAS domain-containing sensor histidine kinase [Melioribacteraceae bacterium]